MTRNFLTYLLCAAPCLFALAWMESQWPLAALAIFVVLTVSLGFAHGAMDILLLVDASGKLSVKAGALYGAAACLLAAVLMAWPGVALVVLIALSLWHFGEQAHFEQSNQRIAWLLRAVQGGSSVMLPVLLSPNALLPWVKAIAGSDVAWVWPLWVGLAALWCALLLAAAAVIRPWQSGAEKVLWLELIGLLLLNVFLSPLLSFALFFGLYHSGMHIWRMRRLQLRTGKSLLTPLFAATVLATWMGLAALLWWMPAQPYSPQFSAQDAGGLLRWLVVALAAVTLPHLILVSRVRQSLFKIS
jgi:beta-carotene 15,15'-dioxygenase